MSQGYPVPAEPCEREIEIRKSRFIARAVAATDRAQAMGVLEQARRDHPDARHHCWAYLLGDPAAASSAAMSDDGEPSGTAGKPILNVIQHKGIGDVMVVVIRYFGGIKLGAGGLVRAYSAAAEAAMSALTVTRQTPTITVELKLDFSQEQMLRHWAEQHQGELESVDYGQQVTVGLRLPKAQREELGAFCRARGIDLALPGKS